MIFAIVHLVPKQQHPAVAVDVRYADCHCCISFEWYSIELPVLCRTCVKNEYFERRRHGSRGIFTFLLQDMSSNDKGSRHARE